MTAKAKAAKNIGNCPICGVKDDLPHFYSPENADICDQCYLKIHQTPLPLDEFTLKPNEVTKEQFADLAGWTSVRNVEKLKKAGKVPFTEARRRMNGVVKSITIFQLDDVKNFLGRTKPLRPGTIDKESEQNEQAISSQPFARNFMDFMKEFAQRAAQPRKSLLSELSGKMFLNVDELAQYTGISKTHLEKAVNQAVNNNTMRHFTGERGKSVYRCDELEFLIENLPPTPKQLPPKKKDDTITNAN